MAKSVNPKKSDPVKKSPRKKKPAPTIEPSVEQPADESPVQEEDKNENAAIMKAFPQLTDADFFMYSGELRSSLLCRLADKLGVNVSVLEELDAR